MSLFRGISGFPITPCDPQGNIDRASLARVLEPLCDAGLQSIGFLGSTGSYAYLSADQRRAALAAAMDCVGGRVPVICGVGALRTDHAVDLARDAAAQGAAGLLLAPVSYTPLTQDEAFTHFSAVAAATDLPICIYNNPSTTHFQFSHDLLARLGALPTIAAVKMPLPASGDFAAEIAALRPRLPSDFVIGYSADWGARPALLAGADAFFSVAAGFVPDRFMAMAQPAMAGDADSAAAQDAAFAPMWDLFRDHGSLRVAHLAAAMLGRADAAPQRPILPLPKGETDRVRAALTALNAL